MPEKDPMRLDRSQPEGPERGALVGMVAVGAGVGVVSGLLLSVVPTVVIALVPVAILAAVIGTFSGEIPRAAFVAGMLAGAGALFTLGALNTIVACANTEDFCGHANPWPFLFFALVTVGSGTLLGTYVVRRQQS